MMEKITVKGDAMHPVFQWLNKKTKNGKLDSKIKWNFQKYLIDKEGNFVEMHLPKVSPLDEKNVNWIKS